MPTLDSVLKKINTPIVNSTVDKASTIVSSLKEVPKEVVSSITDYFKAVATIEIAPIIGVQESIDFRIINQDHYLSNEASQEINNVINTTSNFTTELLLPSLEKTFDIQGDPRIIDFLRVGREWNSITNNAFQNTQQYLLDNIGPAIKEVKEGITDAATKNITQKKIVSLLENFNFEPLRSNGFFVEFVTPPQGWTDASRAVNIPLLNYMKDLGITTSSELVDFFKNFFSDFFTFKIRYVQESAPSVETTQVDDGFSRKYPFPGSKVEMNSFNIQLRKNLPLVLFEGENYKYNWAILKESITNKKLPREGFNLNSPREREKAILGEKYLNLLLKITSDDILELLRLSIIDDDGIHYYPYDYLIPEVRVHTIFPVSGKGYTKIHTTAYYGVSLGRVSPFTFKYSDNGPIDVQIDFNYLGRKKYTGIYDTILI